MPSIKELRQEAQRISEQIVKAYQPERVILFGSLANGQKDPGDIDLLVVKETKEKKVQRAQKLYHQLNWSFPLDLIVRTPQEISEGLKKGFPFYKNAVAGEVLYDAS